MNDVFVYCKEVLLIESFLDGCEELNLLCCKNNFIQTQFNNEMLSFD